jgi:hypothetical protein
MRKSKTFNRAVKEDAKKIDLLLKRNKCVTEKGRRT